MAAPAEAQPSSTSPSLGARESAPPVSASASGCGCDIAGADGRRLPASLASAVANAGGMGGLGVLTTSPDGIADWVREFRDRRNGGSQINLTRLQFAIPSMSAKCGSFCGNGPRP